MKRQKVINRRFAKLWNQRRQLQAQKATIELRIDRVSDKISDALLRMTDKDREGLPIF